MRRLLLLIPAAVLAIAAPSTAHAAVVSTVSADTLNITGDAAADSITLRLAPGAPGTLQVDTAAADFTFDRATFTRISVRSGAGDDDIRIDEANGTFLDEATTIESGAGADLVLGGRGAEVIASGEENDLVLAGAGDDSLFLGGGDDTAVQGPQDGFDVFEGQSGFDTVQTSGTGESEEFTVQALSPRVRISRDVGGAGTEMAGIEVTELNAAGGQDLVDVGDLSGTEMIRFDADLGLADGARDTVFTAGTESIDSLAASALGGAIRVTGLQAEVRLENATPADDRLTLQARGGTDKLTAIGGVGALIGLTLEGNEKQDQLTGGTAGETLRGGPDADILRGNAGNDVVQGDGGPDHFVWNRGTDGADTMDGGADQDRIRVPSASDDDSFEVSAQLTHTRLKAGLTVSDLTNLEIVDLGAATGADSIFVNDLSGTATTAVVVDLGAADLKVDNVIVTGTQGPETIRAKASSTGHDVTGLPAGVFLTGAEPGDRLTINARDGDDFIDARDMTKDKLQPFLNGGLGKDTLGGSPGQDVITGGLGDDFAFMGDGLDTFEWLPGDGSDIVEGGAGTDFLRMSGSGANERFTVSPLGGRTILTRDVAAIRMDTGDLERFDVMPASGADTMVVEDMSGTDTQVVSWELAPFRGTTASDGAADSVLVNGSNGADNITVTAGGQQVRTAGLATVVEVTRADKSLDTLHVDTRLGSDSIFIAPQVHNLLKFSSS